MIARPWGGGNAIGLIYHVNEFDLTRVGHCWMRGRLHVGDLALCVAHSGDCFFDYILVEAIGNGIRGIPASRFGAYAMSNVAPAKYDISGREHHLLAAGEFVHREQWLDEERTCKDCGGTGPQGILCKVCGKIGT